MTNPYHRARESRPKTEKEVLYERIAQECGEAWLALKSGLHHPRINTKTPEQRKRELRTRRYADKASFYPKLPVILVTAPATLSDVRDYLTPIYGLGGAQKQE